MNVFVFTVQTTQHGGHTMLLEHIKLLLEVSTIESSRKATMHLSILVKKIVFSVNSYWWLKMQRITGKRYSKAGYNQWQIYCPHPPKLLSFWVLFMENRRMLPLALIRKIITHRFLSSMYLEMSNWEIKLLTEKMFSFSWNSLIQWHFTQHSFNKYVPGALWANYAHMC